MRTLVRTYSFARGCAPPGFSDMYARVREAAPAHPAPHKFKVRSVSALIPTREAADSMAKLPGWLQVILHARGGNLSMVTKAVTRVPPRGRTVTSTHVSTHQILHARVVGTLARGRQKSGAHRPETDVANLRIISF